MSYGWASEALHQIEFAEYHKNGEGWVSLLLSLWFGDFLINQIENPQTYKAAYKIPAVKWQLMFRPFQRGELFLALTYEEKWWLVYVTESISL